MIDVNWDLAPEGAETLRESEHNGYLRWFNGEGKAWDGRDWFETDINYKIIAKRPTQTKTVADAVEWHEQCCGDKDWRGQSFDCIVFNSDQGFMFAISSNSRIGDGYIVCTREQFEAYVKEQKGEKWTHRLDDGDRCKVIYKGKKKTWVLTEYNQYKLVKNDNLKPIKSTMTKSEQEMIAKFIARVWSKDNPDLRAEFDSFCNEHDII